MVGALVALVAVVGTVAFGWRWGSGDPLPTVLGVTAAAVAVGWTLYRRFDLG